MSKPVEKAASSTRPVTGDAPQPPEQQYERELKSVLHKLLATAAHEELAFAWFVKRSEVHSRELDRTEDRYDALGYLNHRDSETKDDIKKAFDGLTALQGEPEKRQLVAELCEWLRYQSIPPRMLHLYPEELKTACEPASKPETLAQLVAIINGYFQHPPAAGGAN